MLLLGDEALISLPARRRHPAKWERPARLSLSLASGITSGIESLEQKWYILAPRGRQL